MTELHEVYCKGTRYGLYMVILTYHRQKTQADIVSSEHGNEWLGQLDTTHY
jgi:hypothetical protein